MENKEKEAIHNDERIAMVAGGQVKPITWVNGVYWRRCTECGRCIETCLFEAITIVNGAASIDKDKCAGCNQCYYYCPQHCIDPSTLYNN